MTAPALPIEPAESYPEAMARAKREREAQLLRLKASSPLRPQASQRGTDGLGLFGDDAPGTLL